MYSVAADTKQDIAETAWLSQDFYYVTVLTEENSKPTLVWINELSLGFHKIKDLLDSKSKIINFVTLNWLKIARNNSTTIHGNNNIKVLKKSQALLSDLKYLVFEDTNTYERQQMQGPDKWSSLAPDKVILEEIFNRKITMWTPRKSNHK